MAAYSTTVRTLNGRGEAADMTWWARWVVNRTDMAGASVDILLFTDDTPEGTDAVELMSAPDALTTNIDDDEDLWIPLRTSTGRLALLDTGGTELPEARNARDIRVEVRRAGVTAWSGWMKAESLTQDWTAPPVERTYNLLGPLEGAGSVYMRYDADYMPFEWARAGLFMCEALDLTGEPWDVAWVPALWNEGAGLPMLDCYVNRRMFFDSDSGEEEDGMTEAERINLGAMTAREALEALCGLWGVTLAEERQADGAPGFRFVRPGCRKYYRVSHDVMRRGGDAGEAQERGAVALETLASGGTDWKMTLMPGAKKVTVTTKTQEVEVEILPAIDETDYERIEFTGNAPALKNIDGDKYVYREGNGSVVKAGARVNWVTTGLDNKDTKDGRYVGEINGYLLERKATTGAAVMETRCFRFVPMDGISGGGNPWDARVPFMAQAYENVRAAIDDASATGCGGNVRLLPYNVAGAIVMEADVMQESEITDGKKEYSRQLGVLYAPAWYKYARANAGGSYPYVFLGSAYGSDPATPDASLWWLRYRSADTVQLTGGALYVDFSITFASSSMHPGGSDKPEGVHKDFTSMDLKGGQQGAQPLKARLSVGGKYWDGTQWTDGPVTFNLSFENGRAKDTRKIEDPYSGGSGTYMPIPEDVTLSGDVELLLLPQAQNDEWLASDESLFAISLGNAEEMLYTNPVGGERLYKYDAPYQGYIYQMPGWSFLWLSGLTVGYAERDEAAVGADASGERKAETSHAKDTGAAFEDSKSVEPGLCTRGNLKDGYNVLRDAAGAPVDELEYTTGAQRPERELLDRLAGWYGRAQRQAEAELRDLGTTDMQAGQMVTAQGVDYEVAGGERNWMTGIARVVLIETTGAAK